MKLEARKQLVAWLGMLAMLLITCAPLASQLFAASHHQVPWQMPCGMRADDAAMSNAMHTSLHGIDDQRSPHKAANGQTDACGYCSFFDHYTSLPTGLVMAHQLVRLVIALSIAALAIHVSRAARYPSGRPRAPPGVF